MQGNSAGRACVLIVEAFRGNGEENEETKYIFFV